jgi:hypothetical protein
MVAQHVIPALGRLRQEDHKYKVSLATKSQKRKKERKKISMSGLLLWFDTEVETGTRSLTSSICFKDKSTKWWTADDCQPAQHVKQCGPPPHTLLLVTFTCITPCPPQSWPFCSKDNTSHAVMS